MYLSNKNIPPLAAVLKRRPDAAANMSGSEDFPDISGAVFFYQTAKGVVVYAQIKGLPHTDGDCAGGVFGFHIHNGNQCTGNADDPFAAAGTHFNPGGCEHPYHAGDLPPLFGNGGIAVSAFLTDRFKIGDVIGKAIVIHGSPDDFTTQPSGNSGVKIACGIIRPR